MRRKGFISLPVTLLLSLGGTAQAVAAPDHPSGPPGLTVCGAVPIGQARCFAHTVGSFRPRTTPTPVGYSPSDLQDAYSLRSASSRAGSGQLVAIVDAYDDPNAESDLNTYRSYFGLPPCTSANGCFRKVDQNGGTNYPKVDPTWALEISLDVQMVSAICPNCHILVVEATTNLFTDLGAAENEAALLGANVISNSFGGTEFSQETTEAAYNHPGVAITASTGDAGFGTWYPSVSPYVTAVGGTTLTKSSGARGWTETVWSGAGSGCSTYESQPSWQAANQSISGVCAKRAVADVAFVADPATGVSAYDSFQWKGQAGWWLFGGTSVGSPAIAAIYALAGNAERIAYGSFPYSHTNSLFDVTSGSNGVCGNILCTGVTGWDGPTGLGSPNGTGAF